jgi:hypothetical protein
MLPGRTCLMLVMVRVRDMNGSNIPFVSIETIEVDGFRSIFATSEVVLQHGTESGDIRCSVADWDLAIILF